MAKKKSLLRRVLVALLIVVVATCAGFTAWAADYYHAGDAAASMVAAGSANEGNVAVLDGDSWIAVGDPNADAGLVFYPGAKVEPAAYVPLAAKLAQRGVFCVIVKMPLGFAFFDINAADSVMAAYPQVGRWWVGGHSLGGAMAASYAEKNANKLEGVALLGAFGSQNLAATGLNIKVVYGSADGVVNRDSLKKCTDTLPANSVCVIEGGNHAGFGDYGTQSGDGEATILPDEQQERAAAAISEAIAAARQ